MTVMLYLKLLTKEMKYRLGLLVVSALAFAVMFYINGYVMGTSEYLYMLFALAACAVILSEDEKDFLILGHIQLMKVFMFRFIASVLSVTAVPMAIIILFTKERRPIKAALAFAVTVLLIAAIGAFFRVVLKSTLASMIFSLIVFTLLLFSTELGMFSPFGSMSIANMEKFYWNRGIWFGVAAVLIGISCAILHFQDRYRIGRLPFMHSKR